MPDVRKSQSVSLSSSGYFDISDLRSLVESAASAPDTAKVSINKYAGDPPYSGDHYELEITW